ncbi:MAG: PDZ domain-containing protein, partial [Alistipes sp.]|nr:PDZ domain-containing protein [Alistipes sp.]
TEVALIKIEATDLPTVPMGNSEDLRLGEWVLAIGSPYGLQSTVTAGIVSAKGRSLKALSQYGLESFIQTDAAINPGNSGGALVNTKGELVGINTLIQSQTGSYIGYAFAVPTSIVKKVVMDLKEYGVVQRAMLGISYKEIDENFLESNEAKEAGITEAGGLYIGEVMEKSAASEAGLKVGDILVEINGKKIESSAQLSEEMATHRPNDKITIGIKRGSEMKQIEVVLRNKTGNTGVITKETVTAYDALGGEFADASQKAIKALKIRGGAVVTSVKPQGVLAEAGIRTGSVITHINDRAVTSADVLNRITEPIRSLGWINPDGTADRLRIMFGK